MGMADAKEIELWNLVNKAILRSLDTFGDVFAKDVTRDLLANDVVPVVRCKGCKYCVYTSRLFGDVRCGKLFTYNIKEDGFCSYGERRNDE